MKTVRHFPKLIEIAPRDNFHLWVHFDDGISGEVDLSHLSQKGVFAAWKTTLPFESVTLSKELGVPTWGEDLEIDAFNLYLTLVGKTFEEWKEEELEHAAY